MLTMEEGLTLSLPSSDIDYLETKNNFSVLFSERMNGEVSAELEPDYEQFLADVWVGIVLTLMVLSCVCCMCSCLLYHKFQQWKRNVIEAHNTANLESGTVEVDLPSYTIASGLPTYQEALEQLKKVKELSSPKNGQKINGNSEWVPHTPPTPLSVVDLFPTLYATTTNKTDSSVSSTSKLS